MEYYNELGTRSIEPSGWTRTVHILVLSMPFTTPHGFTNTRLRYPTGQILWISLFQHEYCLEYYNELGT